MHYFKESCLKYNALNTFVDLYFTQNEKYIWIQQYSIHNQQSIRIYIWKNVCICQYYDFLEWMEKKDLLLFIFQKTKLFNLCAAFLHIFSFKVQCYMKKEWFIHFYTLLNNFLVRKRKIWLFYDKIRISWVVYLLIKYSRNKNIKVV